ncbi:hypothetical protein M8C21_029974, partial [Ambrosia artemisiifolia]
KELDRGSDGNGVAGTGDSLSHGDCTGDGGSMMIMLFQFMCNLSIIFIKPKKLLSRAQAVVVIEAEYGKTYVQDVTEVEEGFESNYHFCKRISVSPSSEFHKTVANVVL